jgi:SAM-dependent methyltransferase
LADDFELVAPRAMAKFIALQRTHLQPSAVRFSRRIVGADFFNRHLLEHLVPPRRILSAYMTELRGEFAAITPALPPTAKHILDVGCGLAGIDILLYAHYREGQPHIYLMDKSTTDSHIHYGHEQTASFYNDLSVARAFLEQNAVPASAIHLIEAERGNISAQHVEFDLIVSLLSWGFHYPLSTYLDEALQRLAPRGAIVVDIRKGSQSFEELQQLTGAHYDVLADAPKHLRVQIAKD